jgi:hypothetical protein
MRVVALLQRFQSRRWEYSSLWHPLVGGEATGGTAIMPTSLRRCEPSLPARRDQPFAELILRPSTSSGQAGSRPFGGFGRLTAGKLPSTSSGSKTGQAVEYPTRPTRIIGERFWRSSRGSRKLPVVSYQLPVGRRAMGFYWQLTTRNWQLSSPGTATSAGRRFADKAAALSSRRGIFFWPLRPKLPGG